MPSKDFLADAKPVSSQDDFLAQAKPVEASAQPGLLDRIEENWRSNTEPISSDGTIGTAIHNIGGRAAKAFASPVLHPIDTVTGLAKGASDAMSHTVSPDNPLLQRVQEFGEEYKTDKPLAFENAAGDVLGSIAGSKAGGVLGEAARPILETVGGKMQDAGTGIMNRGVLGSRISDMKRGADPGRGYLENDLGPSLTMGGIAKKAGAAKAATGSQIGKVIDEATASGKIIPTNEGIAPIAKPLNRALNVVSGPGGSSTAPINELYDTFQQPALNAISKGGFTPRELFNIKKNVAENTSWGDPTQIGLKSIRQNITGGIGGTLEKFVPELEPLNQSYQDLTSLDKLAKYRANTGQTPITTIGRRAMEAAAGGALGAAHHPILAALPTALDTIPVKTTAATGLFKVGGALPDATPVGAALFGGAGIARAVKPNAKPKKEQN